MSILDKISGFFGTKNEMEGGSDMPETPMSEPEAPVINPEPGMPSEPEMPSDEPVMPSEPVIPSEPTVPAEGGEENPPVEGM